MSTPVPLREPTFLILTALAREPMHGYGIVTEVAALSDGRLALRPGTLYGALDRLSDEGLVEPDREEVVGGRLRRYYRLTDSGTAALTAETERLRRNVEAASQRLRVRSARGSEGSAIRPAPAARPAVRLAGGPA
ncbi:helix-turn-helix transcriptional regulator [Plantactinospora veratri]|uniref:Helix-turn-helix transcriptional regulator n=1 Tax=Plantactinospora veratri TaxID=1436122 RepID=A0ABU7SB50_9ACTN